MRIYKRGGIFNSGRKRTEKHFSRLKCSNKGENHMLTISRVEDVIAKIKERMNEGVIEFNIIELNDQEVMVTGGYETFVTGTENAEHISEFIVMYSPKSNNKIIVETTEQNEVNKEEENEMLNIVTIKNLLEESGLKKVQFIKVVDETKYVYEYEVGEDQYATIAIETDGLECEEDALKYFEAKYVFVGQYENGYIVETKVTKYVDGEEFRVIFDEVKTYKKVKSAYEFASKLAKESNASFNGVVCMC